MFTVTREWMDAYRSPRGGYTAIQLRQLDEFFPLKKGWKNRCIGKVITEQQKLIFETGAQSKSAARKVARDIRRSAREKAKKDALNKFGYIPRNLPFEVDSRSTNDFLKTYEWRQLRMVAIKKYGARCQCCGATANDGVKICVDHIKPRKLFPELALSIHNLQILCEPCNHGKGNWDMTDWRPKECTNI